MHCSRFYIDFHNINFAQFCHCNCSLIVGIILVYMKLDGSILRLHLEPTWFSLTSRQALRKAFMTGWSHRINFQLISLSSKKSSINPKKKFNKGVLKNGCSIKLFLKPFSSDQSDIGWCIHLKNDSTSFICTFFFLIARESFI